MASHVFHSDHPPLAPVTEPVHSYVLAGAAARGDHPALIDATDGTTFGYARLDHLSRRLAAGLAAAGLGKGDVLALHSPNSALFPVVCYAAWRCGAAVTTVHPLATAEEFATQLADSGARRIVTVAALLDTARDAARRAGGITEILVGDRADGHRSVLDLADTTAPEPDVDLDPAADLAVLPYSSGTTGTPKGVMLTHRSVATNLAQLDAFLSGGPDDRVLAVLPFFHMYGLTALMNAPLRTGATVVVLPRFDLEQFLDALQRYRVTAVYAAPPMVLALAKHPLVDRYDLSSLKYLVCAAAPLDAALADACARRLGLKAVLQAYGMTELSPASHLVPPGADAPPGTVGRLLPGTEMRLVSLTTGADLPPGEDGEIVLRGPQVMKGYLGRPEATDALIDADGWLHTGDIGRIDADGWLYVVDRVKELIKYKGYQVAPADLEALLLAHDDIADAAVIGVTDTDGNEIPKAYVVRRPGAALGADDVLTYVAGRVAPYKRVRRVEFTDTVPRAVTGKILRRELRARERSSTAR
ncbi:AMP-binding protein [Streptomyces sp. NBC_01525]|uniref:4-coumarate--CoA ligase family protein n=1 Tax=Streptomyces benahoarensis TaxID=2595054 RepID=A0A553ZMA7_9ACTN|nr:AMP-binding protein [Streptomyces benahoarensis]TSB30390.1 4-coumarate--CoA ligase family protein [Streptomyces benahoarensis]TSB42577.1 4-coumarate--CoA ligase family protein [Streptomyces benahoarensis]